MVQAVVQAVVQAAVQAVVMQAVGTPSRRLARVRVGTLARDTVCIEDGHPRQPLRCRREEHGVLTW